MLIGVAVWTPRVFHKGLSGTVIPFTPTVDGGSGDTKTANGYRRFKKFIGITPNEFREDLNKKNKK